VTQANDHGPDSKGRPAEKAKVMKRSLRALCVAATVGGLTLIAAPAQAIPWDGAGIVAPGQVPQPISPDPTCTQSYATEPPRGGGPIEWGVGPQLSGVAGQSQTTPYTPENPAKVDAALQQLRPAGAPFAVRLNRLFMSDGQAGIDRFQTLADRYGALGLDVELQVRYHPASADNGNIDAWLDYVRKVVDTFGANPHVTDLQITNEVNIAASANTSDGAYRNADEALVQGVIAAKKEAELRGYHQLKIGFNFAMRSPDVFSDADFWRTIGALGGDEFRRSLDWVGFDYYPGTNIPPVVANEYNSMVEAMATMRRCYLPLAGIAPRIPMHVDEIGYATGTRHTEAQQAAALEQLVRAANDYRGTYNVDNFFWFDLRDNNNTTGRFQDYYGLLRADYTPKPAFDTYRRLVTENSR